MLAKMLKDAPNQPSSAFVARSAQQWQGFLPANNLFGEKKDYSRLEH
jgi:hypothetical protein